jgi:hypothetical protein
LHIFRKCAKNCNDPARLKLLQANKKTKQENMMARFGTPKNIYDTQIP